MFSSLSALKRTTPSRRLRNSGAKNLLIASSTARLLYSPPLNPIALVAPSRAPKLEVRIIIAFLPLTFLPVLEVITPSSSSANSTVMISGCAFSTSSSSRIQFGLSSSAVISRPSPALPSPCPT